MNFFISSEVDAPVADSFREIRKEIEKELNSLDQNFYGESVENVSIICMIVNLTSEFDEAGFHGELLRYSKKNKNADVRIRINYLKFFNGDSAYRKILVLKSIIDAIRGVAQKTNGEFNAVELENDILNLFNVTNREMDEIYIK